MMTIASILWRKTFGKPGPDTVRAKQDNKVTRAEISTLFAEELGYRSRKSRKQ